MRQRKHTTRRRTLMRGAAPMVLVLALGAATLSTTPSRPDVPAPVDYGISQHRGVDSCDLMNNVSKSQAFWNSTPYWNFGLYIGGVSASCPANSSSFVSSLRNMGWKLMPIWVGPQAPCTGYSHRMSYNTTDAYNQGSNEAVSAYIKLGNLGISATGTPVIYDLENFDTTNSSCLAAVKSFISGWVATMHIPPAQLAGVYGSSCASALATFATISNVPDFIDGADWDGDRNTNHLSCISSTYWIYHQRHKQYQGDHWETWNGVSARVDSDCSNAPVYPGPDNLDPYNSAGCY